MSRKMPFLVALMTLATLFVACEPEEKIDPKMEVNTTTLSFDAVGATKSITITANHKWSAEVTNGNEWISVSKTSGEAGERISIDVTASTNTSTEVRRGEIVFRSSSATAKVSVEQAAASTPENPEPENPNPDEPNPDEPNPDEPQTPELPEPAAVNSAVVNGTPISLPSTAMTMLGEYPAIVASPTQGLNGFEAILDSDECFYAAISPLLNGEEFDPMTEETTYTVMSTLADAPIELLAPYETTEVQMGRCKLTYTDETVSFEGEFVLADGTTLAINIQTENTLSGGQLNENTIVRGDQEKPLRTTFYMDEDGLIGLYFSPASVEFFEDLEIVTFYMYLMTDEAFATGEKVEISSITQDDFFMFGLMDNQDYSLCRDIDSSDLSGVDGYFSVERVGGGKYVATVDLTYEGERYAVSFDGTAIPYDAEPEVLTNVLIFDGQQIAIVDATLDRSTDIWEVTLGLGDNSEVVITIPENLCDGNMRGFSQSANLTVTYDGTVYSKANGYSGTVSVAYKESNGTLEVTFTNYDNMELIYSGPATLIDAE